MLILTRRKGEVVKIGEKGEISISIAGYSKRFKYIKLAIYAPREIPVHRAEIWERIQNEKKEAANEYT